MIDHRSQVRQTREQPQPAGFFGPFVLQTGYLGLAQRDYEKESRVWYCRQGIRRNHVKKEENKTRVKSGILADQLNSL